MSDISDQIASLLNDPAGLERLKSMAEGLFSQNSEPPKSEPVTENLNLPDIGGIAAIAGALKNQGDDDSIKLLNALRPHLSAEKQLRVDKACKMLKLLKLAPLLRNMGLFEL
ncbi:MAG: hypothetical protein J6V50_05710 [Clostridia bacterium]|nr:hypothetical protein [Clostridia bacterium]